MEKVYKKGWEAARRELVFVYGFFICFFLSSWHVFSFLNFIFPKISKRKERKSDVERRVVMPVFYTIVERDFGGRVRSHVSEGDLLIVLSG